MCVEPQGSSSLHRLRPRRPAWFNCGCCLWMEKDEKGLAWCYNIPGNVRDTVENSYCALWTCCICHTMWDKGIDHSTCNGKEERVIIHVNEDSLSDESLEALTDKLKELRERLAKRGRVRTAEAD